LICDLASATEDFVNQKVIKLRSQGYRYFGNDPSALPEAHINSQYFEPDLECRFQDIDEKFVDPICEGYQAVLWSLALLGRESTWSNPVIDLNFAYRICLETSRYTLMPVKKLQKDYKWKPLGLVSFQEHNLYDELYDNFNERTILIPKSVEEVRQERQNLLDQNKVELLKINISQIYDHSELWKLIFKRTVQIQENKQKLKIEQQKRKETERKRLENKCVFCDYQFSVKCEICGKKICSKHQTKCFECGKTICPQCMAMKGMFRTKIYCKTHANK